LQTRLQLLILSTITLALLLGSCSEGTVSPEQQLQIPGTGTSEQLPATAAIALSDTAEETVSNLARVYLRSLEQHLAETSTLLAEFRKASLAFLDNPDSASLDTLRETWSRAYLSFERSSIDRHFIALLLPDGQAQRVRDLEFQLDQWPILPGYVDSLADYPLSGFINDVDLVINETNLRSQHGLFDLHEATVGFHVLEFLIWGEQPESPRTARLFLPATQLSPDQADAGYQIAQLPSNRRRDYLNLASELLQRDHQALVQIWSDYSAQLSSQLDKLPAARSLALLLQASRSTLGIDLLDKSLYPILNGDFSGAQPAPFSGISDQAAIATLSGIEDLLLNTRGSDGRALDQILTELSPDFERSFYSSLDGSKACVVTLFGRLEEIRSIEASSGDTQPKNFEVELQVVECINLLSSLQDQIEEIGNGVGPAKNPERAD
jgi:putative iron-regulated protein